MSSSKTFAEIYCEREKVTPSELHTILFRETLYPHARLIAGLVGWLQPRHFLADYEFIEDVGYLRNLQDLTPVLGSFIEHPSNRGMLRRRFRIRVSARRMLELVRTVLAWEEATQPLLRSDRDTLEPFERRTAGPSVDPLAKDSPATQ